LRCNSITYIDLSRENLESTAGVAELLIRAPSRNHFTGRSLSLKKTVVICDTQPVAIEGLRALLAEHQELAVAGEATSLMAGMELVRNLSPTLLVVDKSFGLQPVIDWVGNARSNGRHVAVVVWGHSVNEAEALRIVQAGAQGVIRKTAPLRSLLDCLKTVAGGNAWMDDLMFQNAEKPNGSGRSNLTMREQQVAELVEQGLKNKGDSPSSRNLPWDRQDPPQAHFREDRRSRALWPGTFRVERARLPAGSTLQLSRLEKPSFSSAIPPLVLS